MQVKVRIGRPTECAEGDGMNLPVIILNGTPKTQMLIVPVIQILPGMIYPYRAIVVNLN